MNNLLNLTMTAAAAAHIQKLLNEKGEQAGFRLSVKAAGCSGYKYVPDIVAQPQAGDQQLEIANIKVFVDGKHVDVLRNIVIDFAKKDLGMGQLVFINPNAKGACGCGESFTV